MNEKLEVAVVRKELRFYKDGDGWYADVEGHAQAENRMVAGADALIESFANGGREVRVVLSADCEETDDYQVKLTRILHDPFGATYLAKVKGRFMVRPAWLCNVTHTVLGEHPKTIYIHSIVA